jgi:prolipoprotein diacylglyceryltransferase
VYGVWRFCFEFARQDDRGATIIPFLSPSQLVAILMILIAAAYLVLWYLYVKKPKLKANETTSESIE